MFCQKCGQLIDNDSEFCIRCGANTKADILNVQPQYPPVNPVPTNQTNMFNPQLPTAPKKKKNGYLIAAIICIGLVVIISIGSVVNWLLQQPLRSIYNPISQSNTNNSTTFSIQSSLDLLHDSTANRKDRKAAAIALVQSGDPTAIEEVRAFLSLSNELESPYTFAYSENVSLKSSIAVALYNIDNNPIEKPLGIVLLSSGYLSLDDENVESLVAVIKKRNNDPYEDHDIQEKIVGALEKKGVAAVDPMIDVLKNMDHEEYIQYFIIQALGNIGDIRAYDILISIYLDDKPSVVIRTDAMNAMSMICIKNNDERAIDPLKETLQDKTESLDMRRIAAQDLVLFRKSDTVTMLLSAFNEFCDEAMAKAYLNCENCILEDAAREWARTNGYVISNYSTSGGASNKAWD